MSLNQSYNHIRHADHPPSVETAPPVLTSQSSDVSVARSDKDESKKDDVYTIGDSLRAVLGSNTPSRKVITLHKAFFSGSELFLIQWEFFDIPRGSPSSNFTNHREEDQSTNTQPKTHPPTTHPPTHRLPTDKPVARLLKRADACGSYVV